MGYEAGSKEKSNTGSLGPIICAAHCKMKTRVPCSNIIKWDFPGGPVVKTPHSQCRGHGFDPWLGN